MQARIRAAVENVSEQADRAYREAEARARALWEEEKFAEARAALQAVIDVHGIERNVEAARRLLQEVEAAEKLAQQMVRTDQERQARAKEAERRARLDAQYAEAVAPAEQLVAAWDFRGAAEALKEVELRPQELALRVASRRDQIECLIPLKERMIAKINSAEPRLEKKDVRVRGAGGKVVAADQQGLTTELISQKTEAIRWQDLSPAAVHELVKLVVREGNADDWIGAGVLAMVAGDASLAEQDFQKAKSLGANVDAYLATLGAAALDRAKRLVDRKEFHEAAAALAHVEAHYGGTPWFADNQGEVEAVRATIRRTAAEAEAESLYVQAVELLASGDLFELRDALEKLRADHADSRPLADPERSPSFEELEKAVAGLGPRVIVRADGQGDFISIQQAVDSVEPNTLIEIRDNGPYNEKVVVPPPKRGLTIRGAKDCWPTITSLGPIRDFDVLMLVQAPATTLERLILFHATPAGDNPSCLSVDAPDCRVHSTLVFVKGVPEGFRTQFGPGECQVEGCLFAASAMFRSRAVLRDCLLLGDTTVADRACELRHATIGKELVLVNPSSMVVDCIAGKIRVQRAGHRVENCIVMGALPPQESLDCVTATPRFRDPAQFDFRLLGNSPGAKKASDGDDVGCRYPPPMIDLAKRALELRKQDALQF